MPRLRFLSLVLPITLLCGALAQSAAAKRDARHSLVLERVVILMRHGVRSPLGGEVPADTRSAEAWPRWPVADGLLTPHGAAALAILGRHDRRRFGSPGLARCPSPGTVRIWANTEQRTIASGAAYADGLAPGCHLEVGHLEGGEERAIDPIFEPLRAGATTFDAARAVEDIDASTGGMDALVARRQGEIDRLDRILDCGDAAGCAVHGAATLTPSGDGRGVDLAGAIRSTSGIAQVLLLEYAEGMPLRDVGWGRADAAEIQRIGALHAALFDVFTRPPYMAAHQAAILGRRIIATLVDRTAPRIDVLVGHDTNVNALAAVLRIHLDAPGFACDDVSPGGSLVIERYRDVTTGARFVKLAYRTQSLADIRSLAERVTTIPIALPGCHDAATGACPLDRFVTMMRSRLAPTHP